MSVRERREALPYDNKRHQDRRTTICLLGASLETGNLGVSALAEGSLRCILHRWPEAEIVQLGSGYEPKELALEVNGRSVGIKTIPVRLNKKIGLPYHFIRFAWYALLSRMPLGGRRKERIMARNPYCRMLYDCTMAVDITGGDSFSDIYGVRRFLLGSLYKLIVLAFRKRLVMLPQTYGPFKKRISRCVARYILRRSELIYSRDEQGLAAASQMLGRKDDGRVRFAPDVAFLLEPRAAASYRIEPHERFAGEGATVVGFNVSGLLYNRDQKNANGFGLQVDYRQLVFDTARAMLENPSVRLLLVPHVLTAEANDPESDPTACRDLFERLCGDYGERVFLACGPYDQGEVKYLIGQCDFFLGSRMHSCIAALSQCIAAVGLAYSRKFEGVFASADVSDLVVDLRKTDHDSALEAIRTIYSRRDIYSQRLQRRVPEIQQQVRGLLEQIQ